MSSPSSWFRITLQRSSVGMPHKSRTILASLGLRKRTQTVFQPVSAQFAGMIMRVKELVEVQEVDRPSSPKEMRDARKTERGFWLEKRVPR